MTEETYGIHQPRFSTTCKTKQSAFFCNNACFNLLTCVTGAIRNHCDEAVNIVSDLVNEWLESVDVNLQVQFLDECISTIEILDLLKDPEMAGQSLNSFAQRMRDVSNKVAQRKICGNLSCYVYR